MDYLPEVSNLLLILKPTAAEGSWVSVFLLCQMLFKMFSETVNKATDIL